jgi:predicted enzyme related to lactoylglutathione lyase
LKKHFPGINIVEGTHVESPEVVRMFIAGMQEMLTQPQKTMADMGHRPCRWKRQMPSHWGVYVTVDDVDATAKKAEELGAKTVVPLTDVPDVGRLYSFQDPQGAVISVITYADMDQ